MSKFSLFNCIYSVVNKQNKTKKKNPEPYSMLFGLSFGLFGLSFGLSFNCFAHSVVP